MVKALLKNGAAPVKGLTSKKGNKFDAILRYEKNPDNDYFSWKMEFANSEQQNPVKGQKTNNEANTAN